MEDKPFKRISKRLLAPNSLIVIPPTLPPTPPPDASAADEAAAAHEKETQRIIESRRQFREDVLLDFAAFESSIIRIQFLLTSNAKERVRYIAEKLKIQATAQEVRYNTAELRVQLEEAQKTLALRKTYDELAEKITNNRLLRPREDQHANLEKLNTEIAELEQESRDYAQTWAERRQQFGRIIDEGMHLRRLIRDEKEEVERREGMEEREDGDEGESVLQRGRSSGFNTPRHDAGGATPMHSTHEIGSLMPGNLTVDGSMTPRGKSPLRTSQIAPQPDEQEPQTVEDINMAEDGEVSAGVEAVAAPAEGLVADEREQAEQEKTSMGVMVTVDQMDTT